VRVADTIEYNHGEQEQCELHQAARLGAQSAVFAFCTATALIVIILTASEARGPLPLLGPRWSMVAARAGLLSLPLGQCGV
jgi:hypothetical protein